MDGTSMAPMLAGNKTTLVRMLFFAHNKSAAFGVENGRRRSCKNEGGNFSTSKRSPAKIHDISGEFANELNSPM